MGRTGSMLIAAILAATFLLGGCKQTQQPPKQPPQKSDVEPVKTDDKAELPKVEPVQPKVEQPIAGARDADDSTEPRVQGLFPKSGTVGEWKKVAPVTFYSGDSLSKLDNSAAYKPYGLDWAADMVYQLGERRGQQVVVQLFHCGSAKDAYGLMTAMSASPLGSRFGPGTEAWGEDLRVNINKGEYLLSLWAAEQQQPPTFGAAMSDLAQIVADRLPAVGKAIKPDLVAALPAAGLGEPVVQYYRGPLWLAGRHSAIAQAAGLDADDELLLADYNWRRSPEPSLTVQVFVIRYGSESKAAEANDRLTRLQTEATGLGLHLLIGGVKGKCVYGTFTGDEYGVLEDWVYRSHEDEAINYPVMPTLDAVLP